MSRHDVRWQAANTAMEAPVQHLVIGGDLLAICGAWRLEFATAPTTEQADPSVPRCPDCVWIVTELARLIATPSMAEGVSSDARDDHQAVS